MPKRIGCFDEVTPRSTARRRANLKKPLAPGGRRENQAMKLMQFIQSLLFTASLENRRKDWSFSNGHCRCIAKRRTRQEWPKFMAPSAFPGSTAVNIKKRWDTCTKPDPY